MTHGKSVGTEKPSWLPPAADGHREQIDRDVYRSLDQLHPHKAEGPWAWDSWQQDCDFMPFARVTGADAASTPDLDPPSRMDCVPWGKPAEVKPAKRAPVPMSDLRRAFAPVVFATAFALALLNHGAIADKGLQSQGRAEVASADTLPDAPFSLSGAWRRLPLLPGPQMKAAASPVAEPAAASEAPAPMLPVGGDAAIEPRPGVSPLQPGAALDEPARDEKSALARPYVPIALNAICDIPVLQPAVMQSTAEIAPGRDTVTDATPVVAPAASTPIETAALVTPPTVHRTPGVWQDTAAPASVIGRALPSRAVLRGASESAPVLAPARLKTKVAAARAPAETAKRTGDLTPDFAGNFGPSTKAFEAIRREAP